MIIVATSPPSHQATHPQSHSHCASQAPIQVTNKDELIPTSIVSTHDPRFDAAKHCLHPQALSPPTAHGLMLPSRCRRRNWRRRVPTWTRHRSPSGRLAPKMQNTTRKILPKKTCISQTSTSLSLSGTRQWHR